MDLDKTDDEFEPQPVPPTETLLRSPRLGDAAAMRALAIDSGVLEPNTVYAYVLLTTHFAKTCVVAERDGEMAGYVVGYRLPDAPQRAFVWQVGVAASARGEGLGKRLLQQFLATSGATALCATVAPDNAASMALFRSTARSLGMDFRLEPGFVREHFQPTEHGEEHLVLVTPREVPAFG